MLTNDARSLSIPAVELVVDWKAITTSTGECDIPIPQVQELVDRALAHPKNNFAEFVPVTFTVGAMTLRMTEPLTLSTKFLHRLQGAAETSIAAQLAKHPSYAQQRAVTVARQTGYWWESALGQVMSAYLKMILSQALNRAKAGMGNRAAKAAAEYDRITSENAAGFMPVCIVGSVSGSLVSSARASTWPDELTLVRLPYVQLASEIRAAITAGMDQATRDAALPSITAVVDNIVADLRNGVDLNAATSRQLTESERTALKAYGGSLFAMPLFVMSVIGEMNSVMSVPAFIDTLLGLYRELPDDYDFIVDVSSTPRTVGELVKATTGAADERFISGIDQFYRHRQVPVVPASLSRGLADRIRALHPLLIPEASITGDRTVRFVEGNTTVDLTYPDANAVAYKLRGNAQSDLDARVELNKYHGFLNSCAALILQRSSVSPEVLRDYGISDVQRGAIFAMQ